MPPPEDIYPGSDLLSHAVTSAVPSALEGLTTVFGMGTGVAPPALPPGQVFDNQDDPRGSEAKLDDEKTVVKPHGRLVPVSSTPYGAYTPGLSTSSSTRALQRACALGGLILERVSRLDAFSAYPCRT